MNVEEYKEQAQKILDKYQAVLQEPIKPEKIYLGVKDDDYLVIEWSKDFSLLVEKYPDYLFYSTFLLWEGVEMFLANNEDKKITVVKEVKHEIDMGDFNGFFSIQKILDMEPDRVLYFKNGVSSKTILHDENGNLVTTTLTAKQFAKFLAGKVIRTEHGVEYLAKDEN